MNKLVVGKYFPGDGGSGAVTANTMVQFIQQAKAELGWRAGVMLWVWRASRPAPTLEWGAAIGAGTDALVDDGHAHPRLVHRMKP